MTNTNQQLEIWKDIPNYEGYYQVSNLGKIKSLDRNVKHPNGGISFVKGKMINLCFSFRGYLQVALNKDGNKKTIKVHQLVAMSFLNHKPCGMKLVVNHINFNKLDNRVKNLEIVTNRENTNKKHIKSSSFFTGVVFNKLNKKWQAQITINGRQKYLGLFDCELDANNAYLKELNSINYEESGFFSRTKTEMLIEKSRLKKKQKK